MSRTKKILMGVMLILFILILTTVNSLATTKIERVLTDEKTGYQFKMTGYMDETGKPNVSIRSIGDKSWNNSKSEREKHTLARVRAYEQARQIVIDESGAINGDNSTTDTTTKEDGQEERKETTEIIEEIIEPIIKKLPDGTNKVLGWGGPVKCGVKGQAAAYDEKMNQGNLTHQQGTTRADLSDLSIISNGITLGKGPLAKWTIGKKVTFTPTYSDQEAIFNDAVYRKTKSETIGTTYETAAIAYIYSRVNDSKDNGNRIDNYQQIASWINGYFNDGKSECVGSFTGGLLEEANAYQTYREAVEKWKRGNKTIRDGIVDKNVSTDIKNGLQKLGPYTLTYVRGYSDIQGREFVDFGGIKEIMLYNQDGKEIPADAWKIEFKSNRKIDENDKEYLSKFPASGEEFYIVLDISKLPEGTTKLSKISYKYRELHIKVDVDTYEGKASKAIGWIQKTGKIWNETIGRLPNGQPRTEKWATYTIWPIVRKVDVQKMEVILKVYKDEGITTIEVPPIKNPPFRYDIPNNWPDWPHWPSRPDYPDYPDTDLTFTIAGIVWEDTKTGKESNYDGKIGTANSGEQEKGMQNVEVKLYKHGSTDVIKTTYTDSNGAYVFNEIPVGRYDVGFVYDGLTYKTTQSFASGSAEDYVNNPNDEKYELDSKAEENPEDRQNFNNKFYEITAQGAKNSAGTITNTEPLEYDTSNGVSKIKTTYSDGKVKKDFQLETKTSNTLSTGYPFSDYVNNADTSKTINGQTYYANYGYMAYVNLGLQKRPESDFALTKDVYTSTLTINGKEIKYTYNSRANMDNFDVEFKQEAKYKDIYYDRAVYTADWRYRIEAYNTNETVDAATLRGLKNKDSELKVFVTYKIKLVNQSEEYSGTINQLVDYFDKDYTLIRSDKKLDIRNENGTMEKDKIVAYAPYYGDKDGNKIGPLDTTEPETYSSNYKKTYISGSGLENLILQSGDNVYLYLTFEVDKDKATRTVKDGKKSNQIEITSYSTFEKNAITKSKTTGKIDRDSAPGNLDPENSSTLEDDSDIAPTINIYEAKEQVRTIDGVVWEDSRAKGDATKNFLVGNGIREKGEKEINDVTVELVELIPSADGSTTYYYVWQSMSSGSANYQSKDLTTGETKGGTIDQKDGAYKFSNYIPGDYIVRFRYGDTTKTVKKYNGQDYKSTTYWGGEDINNEWYDFSSTRLSDNLYSDAKDNADRRKEVINYSTVMKNDKAKVLSAGENDSNYNLLNELISKTQMYATTAKIKVEVEYNTTKKDGASAYNGYNIQNIDFGLEERPKAQLELKKEVESVKITLADGSTLIDTAAGIKKNVQTIPASSNSRKKLHIYMDEEVMQGANIQIAYKITVTNKSEIDYTALTLKDRKVEGSLGDAYYTGKIGANDKQVTTSIDKIADYVDKSIVYREVDNEGRSWKDGNMTELVSDNYIGYITSDDKNDLSKALTNRGINQVLLNEAKANDRLKPGENVTYDLLLTKTISSSDSDDDLSYSNMAEVLQYTNTVGRRADIPGDQDPAKAKISTETDADFSEDVVITPPTGENRAHYFVLTGVILVIIAGGVFVIKKKVLDK